MFVEIMLLFYAPNIIIYIFSNACVLYYRQRAAPVAEILEQWVGAGLHKKLHLEYAARIISWRSCTRPSDYAFVCNFQSQSPDLIF